MTDDFEKRARDAAERWPHNPNVEFDGQSVKIKDDTQLVAYAKAEMRRLELENDTQTVLLSAWLEWAQDNKYEAGPLVEETLRALGAGGDMSPAGTQNADVSQNPDFGDSEAGKFAANVHGRAARNKGAT